MEKSKSRKYTTTKYKEPDEHELQKRYSEHQVAKLEKKIIELEKEIVAQQRIENKLKESEEKYKTLFDATQEAIFIGDIKSGIILDCNKAACMLVERSRKDLIGKHQSILHPPDELVNGYTQSFREHFTKEPQRVLNARVITKSGTIKDVEIKANIINVKGGKIIQGFFHDITKRKQFEAALFKEQYLFNSLIDTIPDSIYFKDKESRFIRINKTLANRFGLKDPEEALGKTDFDFFNEEHARPAFNDEQRIINTGEPIVGLEEKEVWPDGHITWVSTTKLLLRDKTGSVMGIMGLSRDITDNKLAEKALRESENKFKHVFDYSVIGKSITQLNGEMFVNKAFAEMLGYSQEELQNRKWQDITHPDDIKLFQQAIDSLLSGERITSRLIKRYIHKNGSTIWADVGTSIRQDKAGSPLYFITAILDITEHIKAEETIIKERSLLRTLIDNLPTGIFVKDKEYRKIIVNPVHTNEVKGHLKFLGLNTDIDILGKTDFEVFPKELAKKFFSDDQKVIEKGTVLLNNEGISYYEDGKPQWMLISKIPLRDKNDEIIGMVGVTTDITERKHTLEALKNSEQKFRTIFDKANDGLFLLNPETKTFVMCNAACLKMLGYTNEEFLNLDIDAIHPSEELTFISKQIEEILKGKEGIRKDVIFRRKDGTLFTADTSPTIVTITGDRLVLIVFRDITERLRTENELRSAKEKAEESDKLKTAFLQNISHEIRTPLNGVIGFSDMITNPNLTIEKRKQFSKIIRESGDQLVSIVNDIMIIAAIEAGQEKPQENETNINLLLQVLNNQNIDKAKSKSLSFTVTSELAGDEALVLIDEAKLMQILTNLISNAIKFTNEGSIQVNCRLEGSYLLFVVKDTGIGIPPDKHQKIFDRFFQVDFSETRLYGGTGLGLSVVKSYVHFLKGEVYLDSKPGKGSTFYFTIPYVPAKKEDRSVEIAVKLKKRDLSDTVILIAEDDDNNYLYLEELLLDQKVKIIRAKNGQEAIELCKTHPEIELVLMDIKMPLLDGLEATKQIHKFRKDLPIIAQTAYVFPNERKKALKSGCVDFISNPFEKGLLYTKIIEQLDKMSISDD